MQESLAHPATQVAAAAAACQNAPTTHSSITVKKKGQGTLNPRYTSASHAGPKVFYIKVVYSRDLKSVLVWILNGQKRGWFANGLKFEWKLKS